MNTSQGLADRLAGPPGSLVVLDLAQLTFMDSSGIGAIHAARRLTIKDGGTLVVCRPSPQVDRVLEITGLRHLDHGLGSAVVGLNPRTVSNRRPALTARVSPSDGVVQGVWGRTVIRDVRASVPRPPPLRLGS